MQRRSDHTTGEGGYVALMATILISIILLALIAGEAFAGSSARLAVLGVEAKEQSNALAEACISITRAQLAADGATPSHTTYTMPGGSCDVVSVFSAMPSSGYTTVRTHAVIRDAHTNLEAMLVDAIFSVSSLTEEKSF